MVAFVAAPSPFAPLNNEASSQGSTPRPAALSPVEIREPPSVQSACARLPISVRAPAPEFFDSREAYYGDVAVLVVGVRSLPFEDGGDIHGVIVPVTLLAFWPSGDNMEARTLSCSPRAP
jgi:hypothetical protein